MILHLETDVLQHLPLQSAPVPENISTPHPAPACIVVSGLGRSLEFTTLDMWTHRSRQEVCQQMFCMFRVSNRRTIYKTRTFTENKTPYIFLWDREGKLNRKFIVWWYKEQHNIFVWKSNNLLGPYFEQLETFLLPKPISHNYYHVSVFGS